MQFEIFCDIDTTYYCIKSQTYNTTISSICQGIIYIDSVYLCLLDK